MLERLNDRIVEIASRSLGSPNSYAVQTDRFDPTLLNPIPRNLAREESGIDTTIWAYGFDVWHCYEATFLLDSGMPVTGTLKFVYPASSPYMVESKSMKLYLNSFDMMRMGPNKKNAVGAYITQISKDLSECVGADVDVHFFTSSEYQRWASEGMYDVLSQSYDLSKLPGVDDMIIEDFDSQMNHIRIDRAVSNASLFQYHTNNLRSRCRHTKQKDTGTAYFAWMSDSSYTLDPYSLLREVISLREAAKFHEETAEKTYMHIFETAQDLAGFNLCVAFLYARRGSLDIIPVRCSTEDLLPHELIEAKTLTAKAQMQ